MLPPTPPHTHTLRRDLLSLFAVGLLANALAARFISRPGYLDAYYYFGGALQLARGRGFNEPYVWNYLAFPPLTPNGEGAYPSHLYWMPLPSVVAAPFIFAAERLAGATLPNPALFRAAQIPFVALASALPLLSYALARAATGPRRHALAAGLLTLFSGFYFVFWPNTDSFALYGLAAGGALLLYGLARSPASTPPHPASRLLFLSGLLSGLAHLTRADGALVLGLLLFLEIIRKRKEHLILHPSSLILLTSGYLLVMLPWFVRNLLVVGAPLAPGGTRALWLTEYNDLFSYPAETLTFVRYASAGWGSILAGKGWALQLNLRRLIGEQGLIVAFPFSMIGLWKLRRNALYAPALLYGLALFAVMTLVFTFPGPRGGLFHSGAALLPFFVAAAPIGLDAAVEFGARRRRWPRAEAQIVFTAALVLFAAALTAVIFRVRVVAPSEGDPSAARSDEVYAEVGAWLSNTNSNSNSNSNPLVAANNPPAFYYWSGRPSIVIPNGGVDDLINAMSAFGARWAVLDANHTPGLEALYGNPRRAPRLQLRATFADALDRPVYLFELGAAP